MRAHKYLLHRRTNEKIKHIFIYYSNLGLTQTNRREFSLGICRSGSRPKINTINICFRYEQVQLLNFNKPTKNVFFYQND